MWRVLLLCSKLIGLLLFYLLHFLISILLLNPNISAYKSFSRNELARPVMGTVFLVIPKGLAFMRCDLGKGELDIQCDLDSSLSL